MPSSPARQPEVSRDCQPARKGTRGRTHLRMLDAENARRVELPAVDMKETANFAIVVSCSNRKERLVRLRSASPIEMRVSVEDLKTAHDENHESQRVNPVRCARDSVVAVS